MNRRAIVVALTAVLPLAARAVDASKVHDERTLREYEARAARNIEWNFTNLVVGRLAPGDADRPGCPAARSRRPQFSGASGRFPP